MTVKWLPLLAAIGTHQLMLLAAATDEYQFDVDFSTSNIAAFHGYGFTSKGKLSIDLQVQVDPATSHGGADPSTWWVPKSEPPSVLICDAGAATRTIEQLYQSSQSDKLCSRLLSSQLERSNSTLGDSTFVDQFPAFRVEQEETDPSDQDDAWADDNEPSYAPRIYGLATDGCAEVPLVPSEPVYSQGEGGLIRDTPLWTGRLRGTIESREMQYVTLYLMNCGQWQLQRVQGGRRALDSPGAREANPRLDRALQSDDDDSSLSPRRRSLLVNARYSLVSIASNHLGTGQEPLVQAFIVLLIFNFVVLLLSAAASTRAVPGGLPSSVMTVTLALRAGALACLMQAALLLWALREQSDGVPWAVVRASIAPVAGAASALATGTCAAIVYLLATGWQVLGEGDAWTENRAVWAVLSVATVAQAIRQAIDVPLHPAVRAAYLTAIPQAGQPQASEGLEAATGVLGVVTSLAFLYIVWWAVSRSIALEAAEVAVLRTRGYPFRANAVVQRGGVFQGTKRAFVVFLLIYGATQVLRVSSVFAEERQWLEEALPVVGFQACYMYLVLVFRPTGGISAVHIARRDPRYAREVEQNRNRLGPPVAVDDVRLVGADGLPPLVPASAKPPGRQAGMVVLMMPGKKACRRARSHPLHGALSPPGEGRAEPGTAPAGASRGNGKRLEGRPLSPAGSAGGSSADSGPPPPAKSWHGTLARAMPWMSAAAVAPAAPGPGGERAIDSGGEETTQAVGAEASGDGGGQEEAAPGLGLGVASLGFADRLECLVPLERVLELSRGGGGAGAGSGGGGE